MSYLHDRNRNKKKKQILLALGGIVFVVALSLFGVFDGLAGFLHGVGRPLWNGKNAISQSVDGSSSVLRTKSSVFKENEELKTQNQTLQSTMLDYQILKKENDDLKSLLGRATTKNEFILGTILAKPNQSPYDTVIIDIGLDHSLYVGQLVFANAEVPLGKILEVNAHTSLVQLYSSPGEVTEAQIDGTNASIELTGRGGGNFEMIVPHDMTLANGTAVILPNINSRIVAVVGDIISDPRDPTSKVILSSPVNIQQLKWVEVLK